MAYGVRLHSDDELVSAALLLARYLLQFLRIYAIMKQHRQHRAVSAVQNSTKIVFDNGQINWNEDDNIPYHAIDASLDATKCHCGAKEMQTECICGRGSRTVDPVLFLPKTSRPFTVTEPSFSTMSTMTPTAPMDNPFPTVTSEDSDIVNNDPSTLFLPTEKKPTLWERTANILLRGKKKLTKKSRSPTVIIVPQSPVTTPATTPLPTSGSFPIPCSASSSSMNGYPRLFLVRSNSSDEKTVNS